MFENATPRFERISSNGVGFHHLKKRRNFGYFFIIKLSLSNHQNYVDLLSDGVDELTLSEHIVFVNNKWCKIVFYAVLEHVI